MAETHREQISRVKLMASNDDTWDFSDNDVIALGAVFRERESLLAALKGIVGMIENGVLVRNTNSDGNSDWAIRQIPLVTALSKANIAIEDAEAE